MNDWLCTGCDCPKQRCDNYIPQQKKCCPDCSHPKELDADDTGERLQAGRIRIGQRTLKIDGTEFPWYISPEITVRNTEDGLYKVTITLFAESVICEGDTADA